MLNLLKGLRVCEIPNLKWGITIDQVLDILGKANSSGPGILFYNDFELYFDEGELLKMIVIPVYRIDPKNEPSLNIEWINKNLTLTKLLKELCNLGIDFTIQTTQEGLRVSILDRVNFLTDDVTKISGDFLIYKIYLHRDKVIHYPFEELHACTTYVNETIYNKIIECAAKEEDSINSWLNKLIRKELENDS